MKLAEFLGRSENVPVRNLPKGKAEKLRARGKILHWVYGPSTQRSD